MSQVENGSVKLRAGRRSYTLPRFLLPRLIAFAKKENPGQKAPGKNVKEVRIRYESAYLSQALLLLKMRWLLQLHSACCELDYKLCSLTNVIQGLQHVALQQTEEIYDSFFDGRGSQATPKINLEVIVENLLDQMQRVLGTGWYPLVDYVAECNPDRSVRMSKTNSFHLLGCRAQTWHVAQNHSLAASVETAFLANFLRKRVTQRTPNSLRGLYKCLRHLGVEEPVIEPFYPSHLIAWAAARDKPTLADNSRAAHRQAEKLAQLDAVFLAAALELQSPEVMQPCGDGKRQLRIKDRIVDAAVSCIQHHAVFPPGLRDRLRFLLAEETLGVCPAAPTSEVEGEETVARVLEYENSEVKEAREAATCRATLASEKSADLKALQKPRLIDLRDKERHRLLAYQIQNHSKTLYLRVAPFAGHPVQPH